MSKVFDIDVNEIIDDEFMTKDVSELVKGDYYLFHVEQDGDNYKAYFWKDGVLLCSSGCGEVLFKLGYTQGTLQEYVDNLYNVKVSDD
jgi:hypothetical protein